MAWQHQPWNPNAAGAPKRAELLMESLLCLRQHVVASSHLVPVLPSTIMPAHSRFEAVRPETRLSVARAPGAVGARRTEGSTGSESPTESPGPPSQFGLRTQGSARDSGFTESCMCCGPQPTTTLPADTQLLCRLRLWLLANVRRPHDTTSSSLAQHSWPRTARHAHPSTQKLQTQALAKLRREADMMRRSRATC